MRTVSQLLIRVLRYLNQARGGTARVEQQLFVLPYFRDAVELAGLRNYLVPSPQFVSLGELNSNKRQFVWGIGAEDIDYPQPEVIHTLALAGKNRVLYNAMGERVAESGATGGEAGGIIYFLEPMEGFGAVASTNYAGGGYPTMYWLQRGEPYHTLLLDSEPYSSERWLYAVATFPLLLPEDDNLALNYGLRIQGGLYTYLWSKTAMLAAKEFGKADDLLAALGAINAEAMQGIETKNYEVERMAADNFGVTDTDDEWMDGVGGRTDGIARAAALRF